MATGPFNIIMRNFFLYQFLVQVTVYLQKEVIHAAIKNNFKLQEGATTSYRTPLPAKMFLGGNFELIRNLNVGAVFFAERNVPVVRQHKLADRS